MTEQENIDEIRRQSFGEAAELYDRSRPSYPANLLQDVSAYSKISSKSSILEIGAGTGKATNLFMQMNASITAIEPSIEMAELLKKNTVGSNITILNQKFEDLDIMPESFDLVYSAQAFHWVTKEVRYSKVNQLLKPKSSLALFWNSSDPEEWDSKIREGLDQVYYNCFKNRPYSQMSSIKQQIDDARNEIYSENLFGSIESKTYRWDHWYSTADYINLLGTYSENIVLPKEIKTNFLNDISLVLNTNGGGFNMPYQTLLLMAKKLG